MDIIIYELSSKNEENVQIPEKAFAHNVIHNYGISIYHTATKQNTFLSRH